MHWFGGDRISEKKTGDAGEKERKKSAQPSHRLKSG